MIKDTRSINMPMTLYFFKNGDKLNDSKKNNYPFFDMENLL